MLPGGAHRYKAKNISVYENYASKDGLAWYQYANVTLGQGAPNGLLYRVTGCNKCRSWEMAAVSQPGKTQEVSLKFVAAGIAEGGITMQSSWSTDCGMETHCFPPSSITDHDMENQCFFVCGITISVKESLIWRSSGVEVGHWSGVPEYRWFGSQSPAFPRSMSSYSTNFKLILMKTCVMNCRIFTFSHPIISYPGLSYQRTASSSVLSPITLLFITRAVLMSNTHQTDR